MASPRMHVFCQVCQGYLLFTLDKANPEVHDGGSDCLATVSQSEIEAFNVDCPDYMLNHIKRDLDFLFHNEKWYDAELVCAFSAETVIMFIPQFSEVEKYLYQVLS